jgi:ubiquinone biosynthesis protein
LPKEYQIEFAKLQDAAPSIPVETVREMITAELGQPLEHAFATFDSTPLAAGSIGQAHLATLQDETEVVVKVRRPGAFEQVDEGLKLLHSLASTASHRWELARQFDVVGLAVLISSTHPGVSVLWPRVLTIGFVLALVLALSLLWSIFRSGRHKRYD